MTSIKAQKWIAAWCVRADNNNIHDKLGMVGTYTSLSVKSLLTILQSDYHTHWLLHTESHFYALAFCVQPRCVCRCVKRVIGGSV
jgi:hypothetical protein